MMVETIQVDPQGKFLEEGDHRISGFDGTGSRIKINFRDPAGSVTGKLLPTGNRQDEITVKVPGVSGEVTVRATVIDAANPFVFVDSATMPEIYHQLGSEDPVSLELVEQIRRKGAVICGLASDQEMAAQIRSTPKIAVLSPPRKSILFAGDRISGDEKERQPDIHVTGYSMGKMHPSLQLTGAVCLGAATSIPGTVAFDLRTHMRRLRSVDSLTAQMPALMEEVCISQRSGKMLADVQIRYPELKVEGVSVTRTAEKLFQGNVMLRS